LWRRTRAGDTNQYKVEVTVDGTLLDRRLDLRSYAFEFDTGSFSWTGTAQLALALLADHFHRSEGATKRTADELALRLYREFRKKVIEVLEGDQFTLTSDQVAAAVAALESRGVDGQNSIAAVEPTKMPDSRGQSWLQSRYA
jgi:hypothetical protein